MLKKTPHHSNQHSERSRDPSILPRGCSTLPTHVPVMQESTTQFAAASTKIVEIEKKLQVFYHQPSFWEPSAFLILS